MGLRSEGDEADSHNPRLAGLVSAIALAPVYFAMVHWLGDTRGFVLFCVTFVFAGVIYGYGRRSLRASYIIELVVLYCVHTAVVFSIRLPENISGAVMIPVSLADLGLVLSILYLADRLRAGRPMGRKRTPG